MFNLPSEVAVGQQISEFLGSSNNHFLRALSKLTNRADARNDKDQDSGQIGGTSKELEEANIS